MADVFKGQRRLRVDSKGRVSIPPDFRRVLENGDPLYETGRVARFTVVYGDSRQKFLDCYSEDSVDRIDRSILSVARGSAKRRFLENYYWSCCYRGSLDDSGRMLLPVAIRTEACIGNEVLLVGVGESFQIWRPEDFRSHARELDAMFREEPALSADALFLIGQAEGLSGGIADHEGRTAYPGSP